MDKSMIIWFICLFAFGSLVYGLSSANLQSVVNPFTGTGDIVRSTNQSGENWTFGNITVKDTINLSELNATHIHTQTLQVEKNVIGNLTIIKNISFVNPDGGFLYSGLYWSGILAGNNSIALQRHVIPIFVIESTSPIWLNSDSIFIGDQKSSSQCLTYRTTGEDLDTCMNSATFPRTTFKMDGAGSFYTPHQAYGTFLNFYFNKSISNLGKIIERVDTYDFQADTYFNVSAITHFKNQTTVEGLLIVRQNMDLANSNLTRVNELDVDHINASSINVTGVRDETQIHLHSAVDQTAHIIHIANGSENVLFDLLPNGELDLVHVASNPNEIALEIDIDAQGHADVKALDIVFDTGRIVSGSDESLVILNINEFDAIGGEVSAINVLSTEGAATVYGLKVGAVVNPLIQLSGVFINMDSATVNNVDQRAAFISPTSNVAMFENDDQNVTIGHASKFEEIEFILNTSASGAGINPVFYYSNGTDIWVTFGPTDGTNAMKNTGIVQFEDEDIPDWSVGTGTEFLIRIQRTRNNLNTVPIERKVQIAQVVEYIWNKDGNLNVKELNASILRGDIIVNSSQIILPPALCPSNNHMDGFPGDNFSTSQCSADRDGTDLHDQDLNISSNVTHHNMTTNFSVITNFLEMNEMEGDPTTPIENKLRMYVNNVAGGLLFFKIIDESGVTSVVGQDLVFGARINIDTFRGTVIHQVVPIDGAKADSIDTMPAAGIALTNLTAGNFGKFARTGDVDNINQSFVKETGSPAWSVGDKLYVSCIEVGNLTTVRPEHPCIAQHIADVLSSGAFNSKIRVNTDNAFTNSFLEGGNLTLVGTLNVSNSSHFQENVTFEKDVIILGTLQGGSPVKIAGINITNNSFSHKENSNASVRFVIQNTNSSENASAVISAKNNLGETMSIGIGSSNFMIGVKPYPSITALLSRSQGETLFANFYNQPFTWLINPYNDNNASNMVAMMSLNHEGLNITNGTIFLNDFTMQAGGGSTVLKRSNAEGAVFGIENTVPGKNPISGASYVTIADGGNYTVDLHSSQDTNNPNQVVHHMRGDISKEIWRVGSIKGGWAFEKDLNAPILLINATSNVTKIWGEFISTHLAGTFTNGEAYVCVFNNGTIFAKDSACS